MRCETLNEAYETSRETREMMPEDRLGQTGSQNENLEYDLMVIR